MNNGIQQSIVDYKAKIEALLFAYGQPLHISKLSSILNISIPALRAQLEELSSINKDDSRGIMLVFLDDKVQLATKEKHAPLIENLLSKNSDQLSKAALESLVIIAYNQPVTRGFIEQLRGVNSNSIVNGLIEKGLICEASRLDIPGNPISFKTTDLFLRSFNLNSLDDLPEIDSAQFNGTINSDDKSENSN